MSRPTTIDVVQALDLLETCAHEATGESSRDGDSGFVQQRRLTLAARALAERQLGSTALGRAARCTAAECTAAAGQAPLTLGARIVFRTAHRFGRAGASPEEILDASYRAVQRYVEILPGFLHDGDDMAAIADRLTSGDEPVLGRQNGSCSSDAPT